MPSVLRVLMIEDNDDDAQLLLFELQRAGFAPEVQRVQTREEMAAALSGGAFDVVLSDYRLPRFGAPEALELYKESGLDAPFLVCSGSIGETQAIELLKGGANDFFLKDNLSRLGAAIERELREAENRRARRHAEEERKRSVEALRQSEERFRRVVEASQNGILLADATGTILLVNEQLEAMFGTARSELLGRPVEHLVPESSRASHVASREAFASDPTARRMPAGRELLGRRKDGSTFPLEIGLSPLESAEGPMTMATLVDVTERRALEDRLRQGQRMEAIGRLAGGVAHDFNNILGVITGFGELAQRQLPTDHPVQARLAQILTAARKGADLTRQMLAFSRKQVLHPRAMDLNAAVEGTRSMLSRLIGEDIELVVRPEPRLGTVVADPTQMDQVLMNLAVNARDAMPQGGTLTLETANVELDEPYVRRHAAGRPGSYVMLAVSDTGVGMDGETQSHIFEPFFTTKPEGKGTGLGLATVYGIVKQSGGFVWVYSEPAHGATFKIYLPRVDAPSRPESAPRPAEARRGTGTILVVEDQEALREMIREVLEEDGYTVLAAAEGEAALELARRHPGPVDLLLTDVVMPGMNGRELAEGVAVLRPGIRVLYMSGYSNGTISDRGLLAGEVSLIEKPFTAASLAQAVRKALALDPGEAPS